MGEMKHTPGPWEVVNGIDVYPVGDTDGRFYVANCDPDDAPLSIEGYRPGEHSHTDSTYGRQMANARLIAAAPDLVEALIAARQQLVTLGGDLPDDPTSIIHGDPIQAAVLTVIDAALSKAEGRSLSSASGQEADHG